MNDIQVLKEQVGQRAQNIIASGLHLVEKNGKYRCPNSAAHSNNDKNPSMGWHKDALNFHCFTCGTLIDIYEYHTKYEHKTHEEVMRMYDMSEPAIQISKPKPSFKTYLITPDQAEYLKNQRGITQETAEYFKLGNSNGNIAIPFIENGEVVGVKVRNLQESGTKYYSFTGSDFGLFNKDNLKQDEPLVITEGEFDCMILHQAGITNVCSVGTGANSLDKLFKKEKSFLEGFNALIVLADNDEAGQGMKKTFIDTFAFQVKLPEPSQYIGCKDINEVYLKHGEGQIMSLIDSAAVKIEGLRNLDAVPYKGIDAAHGKYIPTGLPSIDHGLNDLAPGLVTLITGRSNGGKSTFCTQIMANAINLDNKVFLVAGEGLQEHLINNLYRAVVGRDEKYFDYKKVNKRYYKEPKPEVLAALKRWHKGKLTIFNKGESRLKTTEELFSMINMEIKMNRPDLVVIDNLMSVLSVEKANEKYERQADFVQRCCDIAKTENLHIILVLHPNKLISKGSSMDMENISGSSDIYNKADNIIAVKRNYGEDDEYSGEIEVLKNRYFPDLPRVNTDFDDASGMILEVDETSGQGIYYSFRWKRFLDEPEEDNPEVQTYFHQINHAKTFKPKSKKQPRRKASEHKAGELVELYPGPSEQIDMIPAEDKFNPFEKSEGGK